MVSIDIYINETTRHADVILPPCWNLAEDHIDLLFGSVGVRNIARWSPPVVEKGPDERADWEILLELAERLGGGPLGEPWLDWALRWLRPLGVRWTPTGTMDLLLRLGPHGDRFLPWSNGLSLEKLKAAPHGIDLGPLEPGIERRLYHRDKRVHLAAPRIAGVDRRARARPRNAKAAANGLVLIGRRELRSNNSWMHNVPSLVSGSERCVLYVHPEDAARYEVRDGEMAILESRVHRGEVRVAVTDEMRPGRRQPAARLGSRGQRAMAEGGGRSRGRLGQRLGGRRGGRADHRPVDPERRAGASRAAASSGLTFTKDPAQLPAHERT